MFKTYKLGNWWTSKKYHFFFFNFGIITYNVIQSIIFLQRIFISGDVMVVQLFLSYKFDILHAFYHTCFFFLGRFRNVTATSYRMLAKTIGCILVGLFISIRLGHVGSQGKDDNMTDHLNIISIWVGITKNYTLFWYNVVIRKNVTQ